jgi:hypothetical protein
MRTPTSWLQVKNEILEPAMSLPEPKEALAAIIKGQRTQLLKNFLERDHEAIEQQMMLLQAGSAGLPQLLQDPGVREWLREMSNIYPPR